MKAILVVDIDDSLIDGNERFAIDGYLMQEADCDGCYEAVGYIKKPLKPMPNRIEICGNWISEEYQKGWNACIEVIENETK